MYITDVTIIDLKCFRGTHSFSLQHADGSFAGWTVFAGRNGSGKTTLLKAIALALVGPVRGNALAGTFPDWVSTKRERGETRIALSVDEARDLWNGETEKLFSAAVGPLAYANGGVAIGPYRAFPDNWVGSGVYWTKRNSEPDGFYFTIPFDEKTPEKSAFFGPWATPPAGWFAAGYGAQRRVGPAAEDVRRLSESPLMARLIHLFHESATLNDAVKWLQGVHLRALEKKNGAADLKEAVLRVLDDGLLPDGSRVVRVDSDGLWVERDGVLLPLEQISDGYRTVTALVADILRHLHTCYGELPIEDSPGGHTVCNLPGVVLIDEVDAHLHVSWQQRIGFWLTSRFPRLQFLVTTHSPFICQAASPGGIIRLPAPGEESRIGPVSGDAWTAIVRGGADDAVMTELFGLEHPHSDETEALLHRLARLEVSVLRGTASPNEVAEYTMLRDKLPSDIGSRAAQVRRALDP